ncbi:TIGR03752 family integrating conjugative element protein [Vibrio gangliei]|uniref:TIGR03752 family integrating conjugative element protein n=1 Tax=Vibrio gangliei TaxID=2077090 RepID=UPI000D020818|nr:TIGR03752 family integrating conjugative element protein [Vibrio gangliei]
MNSTLKIVIFVLVVVLGFILFSSSDEPKPVKVSIGAPESTTSTNDTRTDNEQLNTLVALMDGQKNEMKSMQNELAKLKQEKSSKAQKVDDEAVADKVISKLKESGELNIAGKVEKELLTVKNQMKNLMGKELDDDGLDRNDFGISNSKPISLGGGSLSDEPQLDKPISSNKPVKTSSYQPQKDFNGWYVGDDVSVNTKSGEVSIALTKDEVMKRNFGIHTPAKKAEQLDENGQPEKDPVIPFATIPQEATLTDAVTMSALLGRIPVGGKLVDPYEFKVLVGSENLAANGLYIPNIDRIVMRGVAKGDYTGQCASGDIVAATFVFKDGRIKTINAGDMGDDNNDYESSGTVTKTRLGWISTRGGVPCLSGEYISDAPKFIALQGGLSALGAVAEGYATAATSNTGTGEDRESYVNDAGQYAAGKGFSEMTSTTTDWINDIKESAFGLVYLPTNQNVDIHITKELRIDYHEKGRKISYSFNNGNGYVKSSID